MFVDDGFSADLDQKQRDEIQDLLFQGFPEVKTRCPFDLCPFEWVSWREGHSAGPMIGIASIKAGFYDAILFNLTIRPDMRGRGHGRAFLAYIENWLATVLDITSLSLYAASGVENFYVKCGYRATTARHPQTNFLLFRKTIALDDK